MDFWTADRIETMRVMLGEGRTAVDIAATLGGGCTKRAVIGKANRLGLSAPGMARFWTPERDAQLTSLHAANIRFEDIGTVMGTTRKAVSNRAAVLKLPRRPRHSRPERICLGNERGIVTKSVTPRKPRAFKPRLVVTLEEPSTEIAAGILDVTGCRWAITPHHVGKGDHMFCNHATEGNSSYCPYHEQMKRGQSVPLAQRKRIITPTCLLRVA